MYLDVFYIKKNKTPTNNTNVHKFMIYLCKFVNNGPRANAIEICDQIKKNKFSEAVSKYKFWHSLFSMPKFEVKTRQSSK